MKVFQEKAEFKPVIIKLESQFEVDIMSDLMSWCYNNSYQPDHNSENKVREFLDDLSNDLLKVCSNEYNYIVVDEDESNGELKFK
jgi:hypothetical protein